MSFLPTPSIPTLKCSTTLKLNPHTQKSQFKSIFELLKLKHSQSKNNLNYCKVLCPLLHSTLITDYSLKSMLIKAFTTCWCACKGKAFVSDYLNWTDIPNKTGIENSVKGFLAPHEASGIIT